MENTNPEPPTSEPTPEEDAQAQEVLVVEEKPSVATTPCEPQPTLEDRMNKLEGMMGQVINALQNLPASQPKPEPAQGGEVVPTASPQGAGLAELVQLLGGGGGGGSSDFDQIAREQLIKRANLSDRLVESVVESLLTRRAQNLVNELAPNAT